MTIWVPWGGIAIFISLYLFWKYNRVQKTKREVRRAQMNKTRERILNKMIERKKR